MFCGNGRLYFHLHNTKHLTDTSNVKKKQMSKGLFTPRVKKNMWIICWNLANYICFLFALLVPDAWPMKQQKIDYKCFILNTSDLWEKALILVMDRLTALFYTVQQHLHLINVNNLKEVRITWRNGQLEVMEFVFIRKSNFTGICRKNNSS